MASFLNHGFVGMLLLDKPIWSHLQVSKEPFISPMGVIQYYPMPFSGNRLPRRLVKGLVITLSMTCKTVRENPVYTCKHCAWKVPHRPVHMTVLAWLNRSDLWAVCFSISIQTWILQRQVPTSVLSMHFRIIRLDRGCSPTLSPICLSHKNQTVAAEQDVVLQQKLMQAFAVFDKYGSNEDSDFR